jgi:hypothetical protein
MKTIFFSLILFFFIHTVSAQDATPAIFPGGDVAWQQYIDTAFNVKQMASQMTQKEKERFGSTQKVVYTFNILGDGSIGLINIEGQISQPIRNEIYRVLKNAPHWTPATLNGKPSTYRKRQVSTFSFE